MKKLFFISMILFAAMAGFSQPTDPSDGYGRKQIGTSWLFDEDTVRVNCFRVDNKLAIDSLGRMWWYNNSAPAAGEMLYGNGTYYTELAAGTANQYLKMNAGATAPEWVTAPFGTGTVTSVGISSTDLSISGSPVTTSGNITLNINNLAVTDAKINDVAWSKVTGAPAFITDFTGFDTDDLAEGATNLYSQWLGSGSNIYYSGGFVGIGSAPAVDFDVVTQTGAVEALTIDGVNSRTRMGDINGGGRFIEMEWANRTFSVMDGGSPMFQLDLNTSGKISYYAGIAPTANYFLVGNGTHADFVSPSSAKISLSLDNVENTALSTWAGSTNITTLGTIGTGVWNGTIIPLQYGGTGANLSATGGSRQVLQQSSVGAAITVGQLANSDISNFDEGAQDAVGAMVDGTLTYVDGTPLLQRAALTGDVTASAGSNTTAIGAGVIVDADINNSAAIDATKIGGGGVTSTEFGYLGTTTSDVQTQLNTKSEGVGTAVLLTAQTAAIGATTFYTLPAADGFYTIEWSATITTAATNSSVLGPIQIKYTNATDNTVKTWPSGNTNNVNQAATNSTGSGVISGTLSVHAKASTNIQYVMGYTSSGATVMVYDLSIRVVKSN